MCEFGSIASADVGETVTSQHSSQESSPVRMTQQGQMELPCGHLTFHTEHAVQ